MTEESFDIEKFRMECSGMPLGKLNTFCLKLTTDFEQQRDAREYHERISHEDISFEQTAPIHEQLIDEERAAMQVTLAPDDAFELLRQKMEAANKK